MPRVFETVAFFRETLQPYPKLNQWVGSQCFDIQGPFDNASIIWGSEIYLEIFDQPERLRCLMELVSDTIFAAIKELRRLDGSPITEHDGAWNFLGGVCVRNDSSINLSHTHYVELAKPFDKRIIREWGGWIHFCGKAHQWWEALLDIPGLKGINPYQGEFYDLYEMYTICESADIPLVQWTTPVDARCQERIRTGFSRIIEVADFETACRVKERLYATGHGD